MNGNPQRLPQNAASPPNRNAATALPPGSPTGLLPNVTASLRGILLHNHNALTQAISQLEAAGDIQNELVTARAAHAQISRDLITALDQNVNQGLQLQQAQNDLTLVTQKLQGAREQLKLLESKLASADGQASARHATQGAHSNKPAETLNSANQQILELTKKLQQAASAATVAQTSDSVLPDISVLTTSLSRVQDLEKRLVSVLKLSDEDLRASTQLSPFVAESNANEASTEVSKADKLQALVLFRILRGEFDSASNVAQAFASRNTALEATLTTIRELHTKPPISHTQISTELNVPTIQQSPIEGDIEMDVERTEAARVARQVNGPPTQAQPPTASLAAQHPTMIPLPTAPVTLGSAPSTPSQPTFFAQSELPQRKRQRTSTEASAPEPLPRDDVLHAFIRLVNTTYEIRPIEGVPADAASQGTQKQLVCKMCETRHKAQPNYPVTSFPYDKDTPVAVPSLVNAEPTRALVHPWVEHVQQRHQKIYGRVIENFERIKAKMAAAAS